MRLIRADGGGDSKRVKFVLLCWTGERSGVIAKSRVTEHRAWLGQHFTPTHVTLSLAERSALDSLEGASRCRWPVSKRLTLPTLFSPRGLTLSRLPDAYLQRMWMLHSGPRGELTTTRATRPRGCTLEEQRA